MARRWFKAWGREILYGSLSEEPPEVTGVFMRLISLSCQGEFPGLIMVTDGIGWSDFQLGKSLNIGQRRWKSYKTRLVSGGRITVDSDNIITITNWKKYQSEYDRQKPYRGPKVVTPSDVDGDNQDFPKVVTPSASLESKIIEHKNIEDDDGSSNHHLIFSLYENSFGLIPPVHIPELQECASKYPDDWIQEAFKRTKESADHPNWKYVRSVLTSMETQGLSVSTPAEPKLQGADDPKEFERRYASLLKPNARGKK